MDFTFSPEQKQVRETICCFCDAEAAPLVHEADKTEKIPQRPVFKRAELGLLDVRYLEVDGGIDFDKVTDYIICEGAAEVQCNIIVRDLKG